MDSPNEDGGHSDSLLLVLSIGFFVLGAVLSGLPIAHDIANLATRILILGVPFVVGFFVLCYYGVITGPYNLVTAIGDRLQSTGGSVTGNDDKQKLQMIGDRSACGDEQVQQQVDDCADSDEQVQQQVGNRRIDDERDSPNEDGGHTDPLLVVRIIGFFVLGEVVSCLLIAHGIANLATRILIVGVPFVVGCFVLCYYGVISGPYDLVTAIGDRIQSSGGSVTGNDNKQKLKMIGDRSACGDEQVQQQVDDCADSDEQVQQQVDNDPPIGDVGCKKNPITKDSRIIPLRTLLENCKKGLDETFVNFILVSLLRLIIDQQNITRLSVDCITVDVHTGEVAYDDKINGRSRDPNLSLMQSLAYLGLELLYGIQIFPAFDPERFVNEIKTLGVLPTKSEIDTDRVKRERVRRSFSAEMNTAIHICLMNQNGNLLDILRLLEKNFEKDSGEKLVSTLF